MKRVITLLVLFLMLGSYRSIAAPLRINAISAVAIDGDSRVVLFEQNAYTPIPMASTTKIITALIALNYGNLDEKFTISKEAASIRGSKVGYSAGEQISVRELIYGLMLRSGNDAAIALAEGFSGDIKSFSKIMNEEARKLGLLHTSFESPHGLDSDNHFSSSYDLALATAKAQKYEEFLKITSAKSINKEEYGFTRDYHNINKILWRSEEANGVKTGYTGKAGKCLVSSFNLLGRNIIIVTLNSNNRFDETMRLYKFIKENYEYKKIYSAKEVVKTIQLEGKTFDLGFMEDVIIPVLKGSTLEIRAKVNEKPLLTLKDQESLGTIEIYQDGVLIFSKVLRVLDKL